MDELEKVLIENDKYGVKTSIDAVGFDFNISKTENFHTENSQYNNSQYNKNETRTEKSTSRLRLSSDNILKSIIRLPT